MVVHVWKIILLLRFNLKQNLYTKLRLLLRKYWIMLSLSLNMTIVFLVQSYQLTILPNIMIRTYQMWLIWRTLIKLPMNFPSTKLVRPTYLPILQKYMIWTNQVWLIWKKFNQTTNEFSINNADLTNLPANNTEISDLNLTNVTDLNKVDQTTNVFIMNNADSINLPTKFTEKIKGNLPNMTNLKKVDQTTIKNKDDSTIYMSSLQKTMIWTYQMWLSWRNFINYQWSYHQKIWFDKLP